MKSRLVIDLETQGLGPVPTILGVAWASPRGESGADEWFDLPEQRDILQDKLDNHVAVFHNAPFDVRVLREHGFTVSEFEDTKLLAHVVDPSHEEYTLNGCLTRAGLKTKLDYSPPDGWDTAVWDDDMADYAFWDAHQTGHLYAKLHEELEADSKALHHYATIERPYQEVILAMEKQGFHLDLERLDSVRRHLEKKVAGLEHVMGKVAGYVPTEAKRYSNEALMGTYVTQEDGLIPAVTTYTTVRSGGACWLADGPVRGGDEALTKVTNRDMKLFAKGETYLPAKFEKSVIKYEHCPLAPFNANSGAHVAERLQTLYKWEPVKFTKTGIPSTAGEILEDLDYPLAKMITEHATAHKILSSFIVPFEEKARDGVLRGRFNQTGTRTGRLSSSDPNLQNVPTRNALGQTVRALVIAPSPDHVLVGIDLSNIEGRVLAELLAVHLGDFSMVEVFEDGIDFHQANADRWGVARSDAKTLLYAVIYGAGPEKVGKGDRKRGKQLMAMLEQNAPGLFRLKEKVFAAARARNGVIHTIFGRRLVYPEIVEANAIVTAKRLKREKPDDYAGVSAKGLAKSLMGRAERQIFNALLQGTAADILKILTLQSWPDIKRAGGVIAASVHDELICPTPVEYAPWLRDRLTFHFTTTTMLKYAPIEGTANIGNTWQEIH